MAKSYSYEVKTSSGFAELIDFELTNSGLSKTKVANRLGMSRQMLYTKLHKKASFSLDDANKLLDAIYEEAIIKLIEENKRNGRENMTVTSNKELANMLHGWIKRGSLSKKKIAENMGTTYQNLNRLLSKPSFSINDAVRICDAMGVDMKISVELKRKDGDNSCQRFIRQKI